MAELGHELDPTIWSKTPRDIIFNIAEHSDIPTQINWSCTSRAISPIASCKIWKSLRVRGSEITAYVFIVSGQRSTERADGIVHFLLESAYRHHRYAWEHVFASDRAAGAFIRRSNGGVGYSHLKQLTTTLPVSHVRDLAIDNEGFDDQHPTCNEFDMGLVLPILLKRLPSLQSFDYVGPLSAKLLAAIIQIDKLRVLHVRNGIDVLKVPTTPGPTVAAPWLDVALDWSLLANLQRLQVLEVGRLIGHEARGLAQVVTSLSLRKLYLSCWGWEYENNDPRKSMPSTVYMSALVVFLDAVTTVDLRGGQTYRGLPSTLQHLVLIDRHHTQIPSLHHLVATAILPCENLESLSTTISVNGSCYDIISRMGLPAYQKIVGIGSWQQLSSDEGMKMLHQYQSPAGETLQTNPYPKPLRNIVKTLDQVIAAAKGPGNYRMSMKFVRGRQYRSDEVLIYPCRGDDAPSAAERGPQAHDTNMMELAADFGSLSLEEKPWAHMLQCWGLWSEW